MDYGRVMGYDMHFPVNQLGGPKKLWTIREYGLPQVWVKAETTVVPFNPKRAVPTPFTFHISQFTISQYDDLPVPGHGNDSQYVFPFYLAHLRSTSIV